MWIMFLIHWLRWQNIVDFVVLCVAFYVVLLWAKQTRALRFALMIVGFHAASLLAGHLDLTISSWVCEGASLAIIGLLLLLFQAELQHSLLRWDSLVHLRLHAPVASGRTYDAIVAAMFSMAQSRIGALIVVTRKDPVGALAANGVRIDADVSEELIESIFRKDSPLSGGAVIVEGEKLSYARVVLPVTGRAGVPPHFGTRHRAALGLAETSDALVLVASAERGELVAIDGGDVHPVANADALRLVLHSLRPSDREPWSAKLHRLLFSNLRYRLSAIALACLIWGISFFGGATMVKNVVAPVEFANVPSGLVIAGQTLSSVDVQLRGNSWMMSPNMSSLTASVDVSGLGEGLHTIALVPGDLKLPPGVTAERISPQTLSLRLARRAAP
jgi:diadenylate cyclase